MTTVEQEDELGVDTAPEWVPVPTWLKIWLVISTISVHTILVLLSIHSLITVVGQTVREIGIEVI